MQSSKLLNQDGRNKREVDSPAALPLPFPFPLLKGLPIALSTDCMISVTLEGSAPQMLFGTGTAAAAVAKAKTARKVLVCILNSLMS